MRTRKTFNLTLSNNLKQKLLGWAQQYDTVFWLDSNEYLQSHDRYRALLAVNAYTDLESDSLGAFKKLENYRTVANDWLFGYLSYDLKNDIEPLHSDNFDGLHFPELYFFQPTKVFLFTKTTVELHYLAVVENEMETDWETIIHHLDPPQNSVEKETPIKISLRTSKDSYFEKVQQMLKHIERGDIYEANFCQEFFSENTTLDPLKTYVHLNAISKPPFASFVKRGKHYAFSASPERYLSRKETSVISQPIKGTARRSPHFEEDRALVRELEENPKERSENIMITDLVRNDLSRFALPGTVTVEELCKVYTFEQVHQLVSTIRCEVPQDLSSVKMIKDTFPMGSMTGAPKISAMKIIEQLEDAKRGLYSGTIGYFDPDGNFDFNVVIRSILYNQSLRYVSFSVGGAITANSVPEKEYEECLIKAKAMREALEQGN